MSCLEPSLFRNKGEKGFQGDTDMRDRGIGRFLDGADSANLFDRGPDCVILAPPGEIQASEGGPEESARRFLNQGSELSIDTAASALWGKSQAISPTVRWKFSLLGEGDRQISSPSVGPDGTL